MRISLGLLSLVTLFLAHPAQAQDARDIRAGQTISGSLTAEHSDLYALDLRSGVFVFGEVDQIDVDVVVTVKGPDGASIRSSDSRERGRESFQFETEKEGHYTIEVASSEEETGRYVIEVVRSERVATDPKKRVDQLMSPYDGTDRPGGVVGVVVDGQLEFARAYGMANLTHGIPWRVETPSNIGSVTKQFTAMGILLLQAEGKLALDDDIRKHIPELPDFGTPVTIKNLLNHTGGFREIYNLLPMVGLGGEDTFARERAIQIVQRQPDLQAAPNTEWNYNNTGFILLSLTVERASGQTFAEYMSERVFQPLGMEDTRVKMTQGEVIPGSAQGYTPVERGGFRSTRDLAASAGAGGIYTTVADLGRWMLNYRDETLGGAEAIRAMTTEAVLESGESTGYGLGLGVGEVGGRRAYQHTGGDVSHRAYFGFYPELESGVIIMSNHASFDLSMGRTIARAFFGDALEPEESEVVAEGTASDGGMSSERMEAIAGSWTVDVAGVPVDIAFTVEDGVLYASPAGEVKVRVRPTSDSTVSIPLDEAEATFHVEADGSIVRASLSQGGTDMAMRRSEAVDLSAEVLRGFAGSYFSEELQTFYDIRLEDGALVVHHVSMAPLTLKHRRGDEFGSTAFFLASVTFQRAGNGSITGFEASNGRTKGVHFRKL